MGNCPKLDIKHIFQNPNRRSKSCEKEKKAVEWYATIVKKSTLPGMTKRVEKTKVKALARLKAYGITETMLSEKLKAKGLSILSSNATTSNDKIKNKSKKKAQ
ncbi:MAG TPA: hypothetical protein PKD96_02625 [Candidatus Absconditabacterales bacterium]|nr:hypothetical protein [Candidatus Absconditabacterales bacterium]HMT27174.1 hypothetical protein [Candidatus Absconditabacterales bacterium]